MLYPLLVAIGSFIGGSVLLAVSIKNTPTPTSELAAYLLIGGLLQGYAAALVAAFGFPGHETHIAALAWYLPLTTILVIEVLTPTSRTTPAH